MYYVKKPIPIKALQLTEQNEDYLLENGWIDSVEYDGNNLSKAFIGTLEGTMTSSYGDYVCEGIRGEHWSVKKDIFEETYEAYNIEKHQIDTKGNPPDFKKGQKVVVAYETNNSSCGYIGVVDHQKYKWNDTTAQYNWDSVVIKVNGYKECYEKQKVVPLKN